MLNKLEIKLHFLSEGRSTTIGSCYQEAQEMEGSRNQDCTVSLKVNQAITIILVSYMYNASLVPKVLSA